MLWGKVVVGMGMEIRTSVFIVIKFMKPILYLQSDVSS